MTTRALLDLRGLAHLAWAGGNPEDTILLESGKRVATAEAGLKTFITRTLMTILETVQPIHIIGVLEGVDNKARRRALFEGYKSKSSDDSMEPAEKEAKDRCFFLCQKLLIALGACLVKTPYAEADDTIAYLCAGLKGAKKIYTVDKDLTALHSPTNFVFIKGEYTTQFEGLNFDLGVSPKLVTLYKSIVGDASDTYPGVKGMGPSAWDSLVKTYGYDGLLQLMECVETSEFGPILDSLHESPDKVLRKLYDSREQWRCSYLLAQLHPEYCETSFANKSTRPIWIKRVPTKERLTALLTECGLEGLLPQLLKYTVKVKGIDANTEVNWEKMVKLMRDSYAIGFDYESFDKNKYPNFRETKKDFVDVLSQEITGVSFCFGDNLQYSVYLPVNHADTANLDKQVVFNVLKEIDKPGQKAELVAQNAPFEMCLTKTNYDYSFNRLVLDTAIMAMYVDEEEPNGLKHMSKRVLNYDQKNYTETLNGKEDMRALSLPEVLHYGCDDSICTVHMFVLYKIIMEVEGTWDFYHENEPYFDIEMLKSYIKGVGIDYDELNKQAEEDTVVADASMKELRQILERECSEANLEGFRTLWQEVRNFEEEKLIQGFVQKGEPVNRELIDERLEQFRQETLEACKYTPLSPAKLGKAMSMFSAVAKSLGLPGIRSMKEPYLLKYANGIRSQAQEQEVELTSLQDTFLTYVVSDLLKLYDFCILRMQEDEELWEGDELNIGSPKQMAQLFYGKLGLPVLVRNIDKKKVNKRTAWEIDQAPSTDVIALETWMAEEDKGSWKFRVLELVKLLRGIKTKFGLYYKPYPRFRRPDDGRIHPGVRNCGTITKRPSSSSPNLLQLSKKDEARFRRVVVAEEDYIIVSIDFVQQELVVLAGLSDDKNLRSCYQGNNKKDVHSLTGRGIVNLQLAKQGKAPISYEEFVEKAEDKKTEEYRIRKTPAKQTNFLMVYGGSPAGLSRKSIVPKETAEQWVSVFFSTYPGVERYQGRQISLVRRHGFVKTVYGTRRHLNGAFSANKAVAAACERQGINAPIQGSCADLLKMVFRKMVKARLTDRLNSYVIAPVYDEIIAAVPAHNVHQWCEELADMMEVELPGLNITLSTSVSIGLNAGDQIELKTRPTKELIEQTLKRIGAYDAN